MKSYKKKKEEIILLKEINGLLMSSKEIEKNYFLNKSQDNESQGKENEKNNLMENKNALEKQMRSLKFILNNLENNYGFKSPYHEEFIDKNSSNEKENITKEISNNIIDLYNSKKFNLCYNLWKKYDFHLLLGISKERNFDMLKYLNRLRDRYSRRNILINELKEINNFNDHNKKDNKKLINQNTNSFSNRNLINNSIDQNNSQRSITDIYNFKLSENEKILQTLKKQINNMQNSNK